MAMRPMGTSRALSPGFQPLMKRARKNWPQAARRLQSALPRPSSAPVDERSAGGVTATCRREYRKWVRASATTPRPRPPRLMRKRKVLSRRAAGAIDPPPSSKPHTTVNAQPLPQRACSPHALCPEGRDHFTPAGPGTGHDRLGKEQCSRSPYGPFRATCCGLPRFGGAFS